MLSFRNFQSANKEFFHEKQEIIVAGAGYSDGVGDFDHIINSGSALSKYFKVKYFIQFQSVYKCNESILKGEIKRIGYCIALFYEKKIISVNKFTVLKELIEISEKKLLVEEIEEFHEFMLSCREQIRACLNEAEDNFPGIYFMFTQDVNVTNSNFSKSDLDFLKKEFKYAKCLVTVSAIIQLQLKFDQKKRFDFYHCFKEIPSFVLLEHGGKSASTKTFPIDPIDKEIIFLGMRTFEVANMCFLPNKNREIPGIFLENKLNQSADTIIKSLECIQNKNFWNLISCIVENNGSKQGALEEIIRDTLFIPSYFVHGKEYGLSMIINAYCATINCFEEENLIIQGDFKVEEITSSEMIEKLRNFGFSKIYFTSDDLKKESPECLDISECIENGKILKILRNTFLSHSDYVHFKNLSRKFIGCSGDNSFQDAISYGVIPLFMPNKKGGKIAFIESLIDLLKKDNTGNWENPINFLEIYTKTPKLENRNLDYKVYSEKMSFCCPELFIEWRSLCEYLINNFNAHDYLREKIEDTIKLAAECEATPSVEENHSAGVGFRPR